MLRSDVGIDVILERRRRDDLWEDKQSYIPFSRSLVQDRQTEDVGVHSGMIARSISSRDVIVVPSLPLICVWRLWKTRIGFSLFFDRRNMSQL